MNYWEGFMNWPLADNWKCQTCNTNAGLTWGMVHAQCRCNKCHTQYTMRDEANNVVDIPICMLKDEYKIPATVGWAKFHTPISEWGDTEWDTAIEESKVIRA